MTHGECPNLLIQTLLRYCCYYFIFVVVAVAVVIITIQVLFQRNDHRPLEVYGRDGLAVNITMLPGDMVLYESHSLLHGRPFPMKGRYMANIFVHFEPKQHFNNARIKPERATTTPRIRRPQLNHTSTSVAHSAASDGDLDKIRAVIQKDTSLLHSKNTKGFLPLHEAARGGHTDVVRFLYESGADLNARTNDGKGGTALWLAKNDLGHDHAIVSYLESLGAIDVGPEL